MASIPPVLCADAKSELESELGCRLAVRLRHDIASAQLSARPLDARELIYRARLSRKRRSIALQALHLALDAARTSSQVPILVVVR
jgi:hypothetical protein